MYAGEKEQIYLHHHPLLLFIFQGLLFEDIFKCKILAKSYEGKIYVIRKHDPKCLVRSACRYKEDGLSKVSTIVDSFWTRGRTGFRSVVII